jgi:hypothetical protein
VALKADEDAKAEQIDTKNPAITMQIGASLDLKSESELIVFL